MKFYKKRNINVAIIATQFDLRGFLHPLGVRMELPNTAKSIQAILGNFIAFAVGLGRKNESKNIPTDPEYFDVLCRRKTDKVMHYKDYVALSRRLKSCCGMFQCDAIREIIKEILSQYHQYWKNAGDKKVPASVYLPAVINKTTGWGKTILALVEVFQVDKKLLRP